MTEKPTQKLTVEAAAARLNLSLEALRKRIRRGTQLAVKEGGRWWVLLPIENVPPTVQDKPPPEQDTSGQEARHETTLLQQQIAFQKETISRLERELEDWKQQAQQALKTLDQQQQLALPDRLKDMKALPEQAGKKRWWEVWKR